MILTENVKVIPSYTREYEIRCIECGQQNAETETSSFCIHCHGVLDVIYSNYNGSQCQLPLSPNTSHDSIRSRPSELQYCPNLSKKLGLSIYAKNEGMNKSGSFKDLGSYVEVNKALELGYNGICLSSTGNMAASVAMYAKMYGINCSVLVPANTDSAKLLMVEGCGAQLLRIDSDYSTCEQLTRELAAEHALFLSGDYFWRAEGQKQIAWEILLQSMCSNYDQIVIPVGCGTLYSSIGKGYQEMEAAHLIFKRPQLIGVQAEGSAAMIKSLAAGKMITIDTAKTAAAATAVRTPIDYSKVKKFATWSNGFGVTVSEDAIREARQMLICEEAIYAESAGALPLAAVLEHPQMFGKRNNVLLIISGHGLKDSTPFNCKSTKTIKPNIEDVSAIYNT